MSIRLPKSASAPSARAISVAIGIAQPLEVADPELKIAKINDTDFICRYIVKNTGSISGSEISQCYVGNEEADKMEPIKKLQGFCKTHLEPGEHKEIGITLDERSFSNWSVSKNAWVVQNSSYKIYIGASCEDIRLKSEVNL